VRPARHAATAGYALFLGDVSSIDSDAAGGLKIDEDASILIPDNPNDLVDELATTICPARGLQSIPDRLEVSNAQE